MKPETLVGRLKAYSEMPTSNLREIAPDLQSDQNGWWWGQQTLRDVSYPADGNAVHFAVEDASFWYAHRNRCILQAMKLFPPPGMLFDIGGGNGCVARAVQDAGLDVVLVEPALDGVRNAVKRGIRQVVRATLEDAGFRAGTLPAVGLFDVLEHIAGDHEFLATANRLLIPAGRIYVTVPAHPWLWSNADILLGHARRYSIPALRRLLEKTGYVVEFATYFFGFLPIPIFLRRVVPYRLGITSSMAAIQSDHDPGHPLAARILDVLTGWELRRIAEGRPLRTGGSCLVVARKR